MKSPHTDAKSRSSPSCWLLVRYCQWMQLMVTPTNNDFTSQKIILSALCEVNLYLEKRILIPRKVSLKYRGVPLWNFIFSKLSVLLWLILTLISWFQTTNVCYVQTRQASYHLHFPSHAFLPAGTVVSHCCETLKPTDGHTLTQQPWIEAGEGSPGPGLRSETPDWDGLQACYSSRDVIVIYDVSYWLSLMVQEGKIIQVIQMFCW